MVRSHWGEEALDTSARSCVNSRLSLDAPSCKPRTSSVGLREATRHAQHVATNEFAPHGGVRASGRVRAGGWEGAQTRQRPPLLRAALALQAPDRTLSPGTGCAWRGVSCALGRAARGADLEALAQEVTHPAAADDSGAEARHRLNVLGCHLRVPPCRRNLRSEGGELAKRRGPEAPATRRSRSPGEEVGHD